MAPAPKDVEISWVRSGDRFGYDNPVAVTREEAIPLFAHLSGMLDLIQIVTNAGRSGSVLLPDGSYLHHAPVRE